MAADSSAPVTDDGPPSDPATSEKPSRKRMSRRRKGWLIACSIIAAILAIVLVYGFVITRSGYWLLSQLKPDTQEQQLSFASASETTQVIADEGFTLLRNEDDLLPLGTSAQDKAPINLFGMRSVQLVYNAGGSSASNVDEAIRLEDALTGENGNFAVNEDLLNLYYNYYKSGDVSIDGTDAPANSSASEFIEEPSNITVPEVPGSAYEDTTLYEDGRTILEHAKDYSDTAMIVLGRGGGEMYDFSPEELRLSEEERALVEDVADTFEDVVLVLNTANPLELGFLDEHPSIKSVIWIGYPGQSGIESLARILNGTVNPSGHLADTWLRDNTASPAANNYLQASADGSWEESSFHYDNSPRAEDGFFTQYSEGVYVGYKYFETRHDTDPSFSYDDVVMYPFGHGLSYTEFEQQILGVEKDDEEVSVRVGVRNAGDVAGKDVIQVYSKAPYTGAIEKPTAALVAYDKTNLIEPGDTETYTITIPLGDLASYDDQTAKAWTLEAGDYELSVRADSHEVLDSGSFSLADAIVYDEDGAGARPGDQRVATNLFDDARGNGDYLTRDWDPDARAFTGPRKEDFTASEDVLAALDGYTPPTDAELGLTEADMPEIGRELDETITLDRLAGVSIDDPLWDEFVSQLTLDEMVSLAGNGAWQIEGIERLGVPRTLTPDGSTTVGSSVYSGAIMGVDAHGVTYPIPQVTAATWNTDIAEVMGTSAGTEAQSYGFAGWYAPAMNTHRTPFNGRNFEYYSEDGVLAAGTAAGVVRGANDLGMITFIKHFAVNDRETNTRNYLFNFASEQSMREIYLRPFEAAVKEGGSLGAMSSFNFIGPTWAGGNEALLTDLLREEWGFNGVVITDANMYPFMDVVQATYAGGNLSLDVMAAWKGGTGHSEDLKAAAQDPATTIGMTSHLVWSTKQTLFAVANSWAVAPQ